MYKRQGYNGDGYVHTKIIPEMEALTVIEMDNLDRLGPPTIVQGLYPMKEK